jgi:formate--tetrahydrofolate ligase
MQHESINSDEFLARRNIRRLNIDPRNVEMRWVTDFCAQSLREIVMGLGKTHGRLFDAVRFAITVIPSHGYTGRFPDLKDCESAGQDSGGLRQAGQPITSHDLEWTRHDRLDGAGPIPICCRR